MNSIIEITNNKMIISYVFVNKDVRKYALELNYSGMKNKVIGYV